MITIDKRDGGVVDLVSVNENALEPPVESGELLNSAEGLAGEAFALNRSVAQMVLSDEEVRGFCASF